MRVPLNVPTITTGINDTIQVQLGAQTYTITLAQGNVDGPTLASNIQGLLQATAPGSWNVSYDVNNISMTITGSNPFTIVGGTYACLLYTSPSPRD